MGMPKGLSAHYTNYKNNFKNKIFIKNLNLPVVFLTLVAIFIIAFQPQLAVAVPTVSLDQPQYFFSDGGVGSFEMPTVTVTDTAAGGSGTVDVHITSTTDPVGVTLTLTATFSGSDTFTNTNFIFARDPVYIIPQSRTVTITLADNTLNTDPTIAETTSNVNVLSATDTVGINPFVLTETGPNTGIFTGKLKFGNGLTTGNILQALPGDVVSINDVNGFTASGLVTNFMIAPNNHAGVGAIQATSGDTITVSYPGAIDATTALPFGFDTPGGGGGGGLIRPGLVLDALLAIGGSPNIVSPPSFGGGLDPYSDGLTIVQNNEKKTFDISKYNQDVNKQVLVAGVPVNMTLKMYNSYNINAIIHSGLYLIPSGSDMTTPNSISSIIYDKSSKIEVNDPTNLFADVSVTPSNDGKFQYISYYFVPTRSYEKMSFLDRAWNDHKYSTDVRFHDAAIPSPKLDILPMGFTKYDNFNDLIALVDKEGFEKPQIMDHIHSATDVFPSNEGGYVYWLYDSTRQAITLIISDKEGNTLYSITEQLTHKIIPKGDYGFMKFTVNQLNREDVASEQEVMKQEEIKAMEKELMTEGYHQENGVWVK